MNRPNSAPFARALADWPMIDQTGPGTREYFMLPPPSQLGLGAMGFTDARVHTGPGAYDQVYYYSPSRTAPSEYPETEMPSSPEIFPGLF